ncbi:MAG: hypothetical protein M0P16_03425 [Syntrophales bacterium]|jgi:phage repressor protein C with HTH and peptisase S24 domain|nr:hypothetical protein [Syntrophales bacterium]
MDELLSRFVLIIEIIKSYLAKGILDEELVKILGTNENTLRHYKRKKGLLKSLVLVNLIEHFNINPLWLFKGEGEPFPGARDRYPNICGQEQYAASVQSDPHNEYFFINRTKGEIGDGGIASDQDAGIAFRKEWIKRRGNPEYISLLKVSGDAMEPTLLSGDLLLINKSHTTVSLEGGIYAISVKDEIMIRRIQYMFRDNKLKIMCDNTRYDPIEADREQVMIYGKVIWFGRDIER